MLASQQQEANLFGFDMWIENYHDSPNPGPDFVKKELEKVGFKGNANFINGDSKKTVQPPAGDAPLMQLAQTPALQISVEDQASAYVGSVIYGRCQQAAFDQWQQSNHSQAMARRTAQTVKGDFASGELRVGDRRIGFSKGQGQFAMRLDGHLGELENIVWPIDSAQRRCSNIRRSRD